MIPFDEALAIVLRSAIPFPSEDIPLASAPGRILASDIISDVDIPPFNKSAVDGFAFRRADLPAETEHAPSLRVIETIPAGRIAQFTVGSGQCSRIMTGARVPEGADAVVMVEDTEELADGTIRFTKGIKAPNICHMGEDVRKGDVVLTHGTLITPQAMAVLASVGVTRPVVSCRPRLTVISTGDELVPPGEIPGPASIRDSNSSQLIAQASRLHLDASFLGIVPDKKEALSARIEEAIATAEVIILSGGVSVGDWDFVPGILSGLGAEILFDSIAIQPGRPTVFGRKGHVYLFGLPGNPVSSFVLFELLVKPFLFRLMGHEYIAPVVRLPMGTEYRRRKSIRKSVIPVTIRNGAVFPADYHGSAHIHAYVHAEGMIIAGAGTTELKQGEQQDVRLL